LDLGLAAGRLYVLSHAPALQLHIFDVSQPLAPQLLGLLDLPEAARRLAIAGDRLYAACDGWSCQSLFAVDVANPAQPALVGQWSLPFGVQDTFPVGEGLIGLVSVDEGLWLLNAADPTNPHLSGNVRVPGGYGRLFAEGSKLFFAAYDAGLFVIEQLPQ
jgi:hypothetical protein